MLTTIIVTVILGAIIGALARLVLPGRQNISTLMTVVLGIVGALVGSWLWTGVFNKGNTSGIDWIALIMGVIVAAVLIVVYERVVAGRRTTTRI
ncbi:MAG: GlsB/YeaQ/YmgE family stress response membrane protein [Ornithinibacter sp.]